MTSPRTGSTYSSRTCVPDASGHALTFFRKEDTTAKVGENLRRIFVERGVDYFDRKKDAPDTAAKSGAAMEEELAEDKEDDLDGPRRPMTTEELYKMRVELLPHLQ